MAKLDRNFDGVLDQFQFYNKEGVLERVEKDSRFKGMVDWKEYFGPNKKIDSHRNGQ